MYSTTKIITLIIGVFLFIPNNQLTAQTLPEIGAQVFIEPGQTEEETEGWFKTMAENGMTICRIRMFESYILQADGSWDFSLFDRAFKYAEKHNIKVMATFFPATGKKDIGGWKFPKDEEQLTQFAEYIKQLTLHFKQYKSLHSWVLINEPGGGLYDTPFSRMMRKNWNKENPQIEYLANGYPVLIDLQDGRFMNYMTSWMLNWIATQVRTYDEKIHLHVNNHAIFSNLPEYDFVYWRNFLNSLGGSAHPSWHFGMFSREQYGLAMSANSEILLSGAGKLPWLMTEIQGGNNTYSSQFPMCPTSEEITQWLWLIIGTEGKGGIFWSLNPRASGIESGEWALLDFQHKTTDRVESIKRVKQILDGNQELFSNLKKVESDINLLYIRESLWTENRITQGTPASNDGRKSGIKSLLGYFKALSEMGVNSNIKAFEAFDFSKNDYKGSSIILANQIALPSDYMAKLNGFVEKGGKLIIDGLTGYYDEHVHNRFLTDFDYSKLFGGNLSEFKYHEVPMEITINNSDVILPNVYWYGTIKPNKTARILAEADNKTIGTRSKLGTGEVIWIPGLIGLGAWEINSNPLANFLRTELNIKNQPFIFENYHEGIIMKTLQAKENYLSILVNKSGKKETIKLSTNEQPKANILFNNKLGSIKGNLIEIDAEETMLILWQ